MTIFGFSIPIAMKPQANMSEHWAVKATRTRNERAIARIYYNNHIFTKPPETGPIEITLKRLGNRRFDSGNLGHAFKAIQDGIADAMGINDGNQRLRWKYEQEQVPKGQEEIIVLIEFHPAKSRMNLGEER